MIRRFSIAVVALLITTASYAEQTQRYIVGTRGSAHVAAHKLFSLAQTDGEAALAMPQDLTEFQSVNAFAATLTDAQVAALRKSPEVTYIEFDPERHVLSDAVVSGAQTTPYGVTMVDAPAVWPVTRGLAVDHSGPIHIAVIDTGIDYANPELAHAYKGGASFVPGVLDPRDDEGHGSHVAGTIVALDDQNGVVGVAPDIALYSVKVLNSCGSGSGSSIIQGVDWVISKKREVGGNWIMSLSLGSSQPSDAEEAAFQTAADVGILTFAASGNSYDTTPVDGLSFPAGYPTVVSVGAVDSSRTVAPFSQRGADLKVVAPGVDVLSTTITGSVTTDSHLTLVATAMDATNAQNEPICLPVVLANSSYVFCGFGGAASDFPSSVRGKVALIERGNSVTFHDKAVNAKTAGAVAAIVFNNVAGTFAGTLGSVNQATVCPTLALSQEDGQTLKNAPSTKLTTGGGIEIYSNFNGTSMATPHASGVGALVWAVAPNATAAQIQQAIQSSAHDLGNAGFDTVYGFGLVDALAAAKSLAPQLFGSGTTNPPQPVTGRQFLHRGH
ncbi:MAG: apr 1 [Acidobacteria bacterium]|nr:apr 1 [Acidobacteriota bacterium]